ncbi:MAG TPA: glycosyltransferase family 4 protein, partial [Caulobacteraceae bacterium]
MSAPCGPRPAHVLITADAVGGVWTYAADLASGLLALDVAVTLAVLGPSPTPDQVAALGGHPRLALIDTGLPLDWLEDDPRRLAAGARALAALARSVGADLVHLNSPALAADAGFGAPVVGACHSCLATWWDTVRGGAMPVPFRQRTVRLARGYAACDQLLAPSRAFAAATAERYRVRPASVHNGRAAGGRSPDAAPKEPFVLTSGRLWDAAKNLAALDRAATRMRGRVEAAGSLVGPTGEGVCAEAIETLGRLDEAALTERLNR